MKTDRREFLRGIGVGALQLGMLSTLPESAWAMSLQPGRLPRATPESQGMSSKGILEFVNGVESGMLNLHSVMVLRQGKVVAEGWWSPYRADLKHTLYSLSKSFTSSAIGFAVAEGRLTVEDKVLSFFPDQKPAEPTANQQAMRVKDLLTMSTGHDKDATAAVRQGPDENWVKTFLALPVEHTPGTFFVYNSAATYMLSAIIQKVTGKTLLEYLKPRLFDPLGIAGEDWETDPKGINTGGWGLRVRTEDIARFGQMYLQKGMWNGKQLLPAAWVEEATRSHIQSKGGSRPQEENDWLQGYGYQFWRCRNGAYRGDGAYGQYCIVMPKEDIVVAITSETSDMQAILDNVWKHILPAVKGTGVPANKDSQAQLVKKLASLALLVSNVQAASAMLPKVSGKKFAISENELKISQVSVDFSKDSCLLKIKNHSGEHTLTSGLGKWKEGTTTLSVMPLKLVLTPVPGEKISKTAASGTWTDDATFEITCRFIETAHYETIRLHFEGQKVGIDFRRSLAILANTKDPRPALTGTMLT
ncbi:serine hydrolase domain-containing protein [Dyadobacter sandarakinus]|uniref:Serine hydrolase n=1 Tax=Dyadobacter sandarakinus TaxID=2747268 RepID=A0ABX7ICE5_9BACT|nr:serine hydrolase [Dyadobacter sandarakinus]QRR03650.1 serine hydrolase [Dyadobacter sandarakinus]